jgi:exosortase B
MSTVLGEPGLAAARGGRLPWLAAAIGLAALYIPTCVSFARTVWRDDTYAHGPIVLLVAAWLVWRSREELLAPSAGAPWRGALALVAGLLLYIVGRAFGIAVFEGASLIPVAAGIALITGGMQALRVLAFPLVFLFFAIPLPGFVLDAVTVPLKTIVSIAVTGLLQAGGYAVQREGVVLLLGDHQLLVADACSGLNSIQSLFALALLYAHLTPPRSLVRTLTLVVAIIPIAVFANIVRVTGLVLATYYFGEEVAQGIVHTVAGLLVFTIALAALHGFDALIRPGFRAAPSESFVRPSRLRGTSPALAYGAALIMIGSAIAAPALRPTPVESTLDLERALPTAFGEWRVDPDDAPVAPAPDVQANLDRIYRQVVSRTYVNAAGERIMLTVAHGGDQGDALKAHRQEKCYEAQGFEVSGLERTQVSVAGRSIPATRMVAVRGERIEPVTYWFTMGERVVLGRTERLRVQIASGLAGRVPDGMLVRVSSISPDAGQAFAAQRNFAAAIFERVSPAIAPQFVGTPG